MFYLIPLYIGSEVMTNKCAKCGKDIIYTVVMIKSKGDNKYHSGCAKKVKR